MMRTLRKLLLRSRGTRLALAAVFCALFLNGVEYIVHNHAAEQQGKTSAPHAELCGYCAAFNGLTSASTEPVAPRFAVGLTLLVLISVAAAPFFRRPFSVAQPRGPPRS